LPIAAQRPFIDHQRGRSAERHHVGQAVVLGAEFALRIRQAGDAAIEAVEDHGNEDGPGRVFEFLVHGHGRWRRSRKTGLPS